MLRENEPKKLNFWTRVLGKHTTAILLIVILSIIAFIAGIFLYKNLLNTKFQLESCISSCSNSTI